jgi:hypothetical protein
MHLDPLTPCPRRSPSRRMAIVLLVLAACSRKAPNGTTAASYELDCASTNTFTASQLNCVRTDTRSGEVLVIDYTRLPVSNGPTATVTASAGWFTTACDSTSTERRADFYCIRLNTGTGELLLVNLQKVNVFPPRS